MEHSSQEPRPVRLSVGVYRLLLLAYPPAFRSAYGEAMVQVFGDCCRSAFRRSGAAGLPGLWAQTILDYVHTLIEEHAQKQAHKGMDMSRESFLNRSGWALLSGPLMIFMGLAASTRPDYSPYNARSLPIDQYLNRVDSPLLALGLLLVSLGVFGLLVRFGARTRAFGRASLFVSGVSGGASAAGVVGLAVSDSEPWWSVFAMGVTFLLLGVGLFGVDCLQRRLLNGWSGLPLATALWMPLVAAVSVVYQLISDQPVNLPPVFGVTIIAGFAGLALLGYLALRGGTAESKALAEG